MAWLWGLVVLLLGANVLDSYFFGGDDETPRKPSARQAAAGKRDVSQGAPTGRSEEALEKRLAWLKSLAVSAGRIDAAYGKAVPAYAEAVAPLQTLATRGMDARKLLDGLLRDTAKRNGAEVTSLVVGQPQPRGAGVSAVRASIGVRASDADGLLRFLWAVGDPSAGMVWQEMNLAADARGHRLDLTGEVLALVVEAAE